MRTSPEKVFSRMDVARARRVETLRAPTATRAHVFTIEWEGETWAVKDFQPASRFFRHLVGPLSTAHELHAIEALRDLRGVPVDSFRVDALAFAYRYAPGESIRQAKRRAGIALDAPFFHRLEALVKSVHARGRVHLDLRKAQNVLVTPDHEPILLDFQSSVSTRLLPGPFRRLLEEVDLAGIYKHWLRLNPETLDETRAARFRRIQRARRWFGLLTRRPLRRREPAFHDAGGPECTRSPSNPSIAPSTTRPPEGSSPSYALPSRSWERSARALSRRPSGSSLGS